VTTPTGELGPLDGPLADALADLAARQAVGRLWNHDHTLWSPEPTEIVDRLGWLDVLDDMAAERGRIDDFVARLKRDGFTHCVVMGMGGSSLFPEVIARTFPTGRSGLDLQVVDSTDPAAVARALAAVPEDTTLFLASSKSGGTIETRSHLDFFWDQIGRPEQFAVVTDPGSDLGRLARERGFREVFENRADIGGRYSALSFFGMVPAALNGTDWFGLVERAREVVPSLRSADPAVNPGLWLGALLAAAVGARRDKLTLVLDPRVEAFGLWVEQLVAESTGKAGTGVVPVVDEPIGPADVYGPDRLVVAIGQVDHPLGLEALAAAGQPVAQLTLPDPVDLGSQVLVWEVATALACAVLGVNPFDQPNVAEAKDATSRVLAGPVDLPASPPLTDLLGSVVPGDYVSIHAYLDPASDDYDALEGVRLELRDALRVAVTLSPGPRFLHSTGQLHKGGPPTGVFIQVVGADHTDAAVPGREFTFGQLKRAQADGDLLTLGAHHLRAGRYTVDDLLDGLPRQAP